MQPVDAEIAREMIERVQISDKIIKVQSGHLENHKTEAKRSSDPFLWSPLSSDDLREVKKHIISFQYISSEY